ncbi:MAG TPA: nuclear transport factor 2 family protein [Longimicrobiaceae bacterium]|nr:nuclear transport factor 2 family protein [Longimicrobiaceae bacterium]
MAALATRTALLALALLLGWAHPVRAQSPETAVLAAVQQLFDAMAARDTAAARAVLMPGGLFFAVVTGEGEDAIGAMPYTDFLARLAVAEQRWLERMWEPQVLIHGPLAVVWTRYDFYRGDSFSHCGVDAFNLVRTAEGWKIASAAYTVERDGCPPAGSTRAR